MISKKWYYHDPQLRAISDLKLRLIQDKQFLANNGICYGIAGDNPYKKEINTAAEALDKAYMAVLTIYNCEMDARDWFDEGSDD